MWTILEHRTLEKTLSRLPLRIREKYEFWKNVVRHGGPQALRSITGFRDHALAGRWQGFRSSYLSDSYRVVYSSESGRLQVRVERVSKHDYRT